MDVVAEAKDGQDGQRLAREVRETFLSRFGLAGTAAELPKISNGSVTMKVGDAILEAEIPTPRVRSEEGKNAAADYLSARIQEVSDAVCASFAESDPDVDFEEWIDAYHVKMSAECVKACAKGGFHLGSLADLRGPNSIHPLLNGWGHIPSERKVTFEVKLRSRPVQKVVATYPVRIAMNAILSSLPGNVDAVTGNLIGLRASIKRNLASFGAQEVTVEKLEDYLRTHPGQANALAQGYAYSKTKYLGAPGLKESRAALGKAIAALPAVPQDGTWFVVSYRALGAERTAVAFAEFNPNEAMESMRGALQWRAIESAWKSFDARGALVAEIEKAPSTLPNFPPFTVKSGPSKRGASFIAVTVAFERGGTATTDIQVPDLPTVAQRDAQAKLAREALQGKVDSCVERLIREGGAGITAHEYVNVLDGALADLSGEKMRGRLVTQMQNVMVPASVSGGMAHFNVDITWADGQKSLVKYALPAKTYAEKWVSMGWGTSGEDKSAAESNIVHLKELGCSNFSWARTPEGVIISFDHVDGTRGTFHLKINR